MGTRLVKKVSIFQFILVGILILTMSPAFASLQNEIENSLFCPACFAHGETLAAGQDGPAVQMKEEIRASLAAGKSKAEILQGYVDKYGEKILTIPPKRGFNLMAWVIPFLGIIMGGVLIYFALKKWVKEPRTNKGRVKTKPGVLDDYYDARVEEEFKKYL